MPVVLNRRDVTLATLVAAVTLTFFVITLRQDVGGTEDSPKFQFVGRVLGTSHSPGYPFYAMATWAFGQLPIGTLAYRINLFSAVCGALSCMCIFLTARRLGVTPLLSIAAALGAATSYPVWSNSVTAAAPDRRRVTPSLRPVRKMQAHASAPHTAENRLIR